MLTLTPGVDFDLDLVNARVRDGTYIYIHITVLKNYVILTLKKLFSYFEIK